MKPITLRNLPPEIARTIRKKAATEKTSLNKAVIGLLEGRVHAPASPRKTKHRDLDRFYGSWTQEEYDEFMKNLAEQRRIDPEIWQ